MKNSIPKKFFFFLNFSSKGKYYILFIAIRDLFWFYLWPVRTFILYIYSIYYITSNHALTTIRPSCKRQSKHYRLVYNLILRLNSFIERSSKFVYFIQRLSNYPSSSVRRDQPAADVAQYFHRRMRVRVCFYWEREREKSVHEKRAILQTYNIMYYIYIVVTCMFEQ